MMSVDLDSRDRGRWRQAGRSAQWSKTVDLRVFTHHCLSSSLSIGLFNVELVTFLLLDVCTKTREVKKDVHFCTFKHSDQLRTKGSDGSLRT